MDPGGLGGIFRIGVRFDQPGFGNGNVAAYFDHADSVGWTGHYVMGEVYRYGGFVTLLNLLVFMTVGTAWLLFVL